MPHLALVVELKDLIYISAAIVGSIAVLAGLIAFVWWKFSGETGRQKSNATGQWRQIAEGYEKRIEDLDLQVKTWKQAHDDCEGRVNSITKLNLRLQARGRNYERQINKLQVRQGMEPTDWNDTDDEATGLDT